MDTRQDSEMPALFLSHGSPMLGLLEDPFTEALQAFVARIPRPKAIVVVSAHGLSRQEIEISASERHSLIYDFRGFPPELYQVQYPCPGAPALAQRIGQMLNADGFLTRLVDSSIEGAGLDHGVWVPLRIAYPDAMIPVIQISMPYGDEAAEDRRKLLRMGQALAPLRGEGVLLIGSGGAVHNLRALVWHQKHGPTQPWAAEFEKWVREKLAAKDVTALTQFEDEAPHAREAHPTPEHFYPIYFVLGAAWKGDEAVPIYEGVQYATLSMFSFALTHQ